MDMYVDGPGVSGQWYVRSSDGTVRGVYATQADATKAITSEV